MEELLQAILKPGLLALAVAIYAVTHVARRVVETASPGLKKKASEMDKAAMYGSRLALWWNEVVLYAMPVIVGAGSGFYKSAFIFGALDQKDRILVGCGVGWFSGTLYKIARKLLASKAGIPESKNSEPPPAGLP